jgi:hypothetical protein
MTITLGVALDLGGSRTDVTTDVYARDGIQVRRGRSSEGALVDAGSATATLNNRTGDYSPRNPSGAHYGLIGRNTPVWIWTVNGRARAVQGASTSSFFYAPDSAALSITGDIDLRVDITLGSWRPFTPHYLGIHKSTSYSIYLGTLGFVNITWTNDGSTFRTITSARPIPGPPTGRKRLRVTLDVNDGAGGARADYYLAEAGATDLAGPWTLWDTVTQAGTTTLFNSTTDVVTVLSGLDAGEVDSVQIRNGIAGSIVAHPVFTGATEAATSLADAYGNTWTATGDAIITALHYVFTGEVTEWRPASDVSGADAYTPIECSGILRRISQGNAPVVSSLRRGLSSLSAGVDLVAYWPCEDEESATQLASGLTAPIGRSARIDSSISLAAYSGFAGSAPIPTIGSGSIHAPIAPYTDTGQVQVRWIGMVPAGTPTGTVLIRVRTNSSLGWADLTYSTASGGALTLLVYRSTGALAATIGPIAFAVDDKLLRYSLEFADNGPDVDITMATYQQDAPAGLSWPDTVTGITLGIASSVIVNPAAADIGSVAFGHLSVESAITTLFDVSAEFNAHAGETAATRVSRLAGEASLPAVVAGLGEAVTTEYLGRQPRSSVVALLREAEAADGGVLLEDRHVAGLRYRTLGSLSGANPVTVSYTDGFLAAFAAVDDDQRTRNKVTVTRAGGSSATAEDTWSAMSTQAPPAGVGLYEDSLSLSLYADAQADQQASWRVHLGTVDEARLPQLAVNLAHPDIAADPDLVRSLLALDVGGRIVLTDPPPWLPPDDIDLQVIGRTDRLTRFEHTITYTCGPYSPYRTATADPVAGLDDDARWGSDTTTVDGAHNSTTTSLSVDVADGALWDDTDGDFDITVAGERMTVIAVTGASSPQTFTVVRSINGVVKAHTDGTSVALFSPTVWSLG